MSKEYWLSSPETSALFETLVLEEFDFLRQDFNFKVTKVEKDGYGCRVVLCNRTSGIQFNYEPGSLRIWILFYRLVNGVLPEYQLTPIPNQKADYFYLEDLMVAKDPWVRGLELYTTAGQLGMNAPITKEYLRGKLQTLAECVNTYAKELLSGDFGIFEEAQKILDARVRQASERGR